MQVRELVTKLSLDADKATKTAKDFDRLISDMKSNLLKVVGSVTALGASMYAFARSTAKTGDEIAKTAKQVGVSADALQGFRYAADLAGISSSELETSLMYLSRNLGEARRGTGVAVGVFSELGIALDDANGAAKSSDDLFLELSDKLKGIEDPAKRASYAQNLLGRSGAKMQDFLSQGSEAIRAQMHELGQLGGVMSKDALNASEFFQDSIFRLSTILGGLKITIGNQLIPVILEVSDSIATWYKANGEVIRQGLGDVVRGLGEVFRGFVGVMSTVLGVVSSVVEVFGGWGNALKLVSIAIGSLMALKFIGWITAIGSAIAVAVKSVGALKIAMLAITKIPIVAAFSAIVLVVEDLISWLTGGDSLLKSWVDSLSSVAGWFGKIGDVMGSVWDNVPSWGDIGSAIASPFKAAGNWLMGDPSQMAQTVTNGGAGGSVGAVNVTENVTVNVPNGTTQEQAQEISKQVRKQVGEELNSSIFKMLNDYPVW